LSPIDNENFYDNLLIEARIESPLEGRLRGVFNIGIVIKKI